MPKQDRLDEDIIWPLPGREGVNSIGPIYENNLQNLGNFRAQNKNYDPSPARTKPLNPSLFGAEDFLRRAVGGNAANLGWSHPKTMNSLKDLAQAQKDQGRPIQAERLLRKAHYELINIFGPYHPNTLEITNLLAAVIEDQLSSLKQTPTSSTAASSPSLQTQQMNNENKNNLTKENNKTTIKPTSKVQGDAATVEIDIIPTELPILIQDLLELRQTIAFAYEEQYGDKHEITSDSIQKLAFALKKWAFFFTSGSKQIEILEHVKELELTSQQILKSYSSSLPPPRNLYVPPYEGGHLTKKAQPPQPTFSTVQLDFKGGHFGVFM
mmetsp:Transcript_5637/g.7001  ORF Transcript_5637/g.7001 Transcript_5637/m.7001 type:complete len:325 (-) Transcript_5637:420-1394(-)